MSILGKALEEQDLETIEFLDPSRFEDFDKKIIEYVKETKSFRVDFALEKIGRECAIRMIQLQQDYAMNKFLENQEEYCTKISDDEHIVIQRSGNGRRRI